MAPMAPPNSTSTARCNPPRSCYSLSSPPGLPGLRSHDAQNRSLPTCNLAFLPLQLRLAVISQPLPSPPVISIESIRCQQTKSPSYPSVGRIQAEAVLACLSVDGRPSSFFH
ncbi:hypothetical protein J3E68DRAFT_403564 [Trichoderma sp. SZMC 28012]